jgi:hypothetical protein
MSATTFKLPSRLPGALLLTAATLSTSLSAQQPADPSQKMRDAETRSAWVNELRVGRDARRTYADMLASPRAGGFYLAAEIESLCATLVLRTDERTRPTHTPDVNAPTFRRYQQSLEKLRVTCASIQPQEASFEAAARRLFARSNREMDPLVDLFHRLLPATPEQDRRKAIELLLDLEAPVNVMMLDKAMLRSSESGTYFLFDGARYPVGSKDVKRLEGRSEQLLAALDLAACDLGVPCGSESLAVTRNCMLRYLYCNETDYRSVVYAQLRDADYVDLSQGLDGVERLRRRIVEAVRSKDVQVFVKQPS